MACSEYFARLLEVIDSHGGDVLKFCGDAVLIMWSAPLAAHSAERRRLSLTAALCGLQLLEDCGHYRKILTSAGRQAGRTRAEGVVPSLARLFTDSDGPPSPRPSQQHQRPQPSGLEAAPTVDEVAAEDGPLEIELSLHCGLASGSAHCLVLGDDQRREFLLAGDVLAHLSAAASRAQAHELVAHASAAHYLRKYFTLVRRSGGTSSPTCSPAQCSGEENAVHSFRRCTSSEDETDHEADPLLPQAEEENEEEEEEVFLLDGRLSAAFQRHLQRNCGLPGPAAPAPAPATSAKQREKKRVSQSGPRLPSSLPAPTLPDPAEPAESGQPKRQRHSRLAASFSAAIGEISARLYQSVPALLLPAPLPLEHTAGPQGGPSTPLSASASCHVTRQRSRPRPSRPSRPLPAERPVRLSVDELRRLFERSDDPTLPAPLSPTASASRAPSDVRPFSSLTNATATVATSSRPLLLDEFNGEPSAQLLSEAERGRYQRQLRSFIPETALKALDCQTLCLLSEMREVATAFLLLHGLEADLRNGFLPRLQAVFSALLEVLRGCGGSLRQFVVDDKGCVAIACFGLFGSSSENNGLQAAKFALAAGRALAKWSVRLSVGLSSGRVYCGNVGHAASRCEFAVMGRSVNLAARLMAAASHGPDHAAASSSSAVLADRNIRQAALHKFHFPAAMELAAKGFDRPIAVFSLAVPAALEPPQSCPGPGLPTGRNASNGRLPSGTASSSEAGGFFFSREVERQLVAAAELIVRPELSAATASLGSVAVSGEEAAGKSTFLRRLRGLVASSEAAPSGGRWKLLAVRGDPAAVWRQQEAGQTADPHENYLGLKRLLAAFLAPASPTAASLSASRSADEFSCEEAAAATPLGLAAVCPAALEQLLGQLRPELTLRELLVFCGGLSAASAEQQEALAAVGSARGLSAASSLLELLAVCCGRPVRRVDEFLAELPAVALVVHPLTDLLLQAALLAALGYSAAALATLAGPTPSNPSPSPADCPRPETVPSAVFFVDDAHLLDLESLRILSACAAWVAAVRPRLAEPGGLVVTAWLDGRDELLLRRLLKQRPRRDSSAALSSRCLQRYGLRGRLVRELLSALRGHSLAVRLDQIAASSLKAVLSRNLGPRRWDWLLAKQPPAPAAHAPATPKAAAPIRRGSEGGRRRSMDGLSGLGRIDELLRLPATRKPSASSELLSAPAVLAVRQRRGSDCLAESIYRQTADGLPSLVYELIAGLKQSIDHNMAAPAPAHPAQAELSLFSSAAERQGRRVLELLDSLNGSELAVVKAAAVVGREFAVSLLVRGLSSLGLEYATADLVLLSALHRLERLGVIQLLRGPAADADGPDPGSPSTSNPSSCPEEGEAGEAVYCFQDEAVRQAVYRLLLESQRRAVHGAVAAHYESLQGRPGRPAEEARTLFGHVMRSGQADRMLRCAFRMTEEAAAGRNHLEVLQFCCTFLALAAGLSARAVLQALSAEQLARPAPPVGLRKNFLLTAPLLEERPFSCFGLLSQSATRAVLLLRLDSLWPPLATPLREKNGRELLTALVEFTAPAAASSVGSSVEAGAGPEKSTRPLLGLRRLSSQKLFGGRRLSLNRVFSALDPLAEAEAEVAAAVKQPETGRGRNSLSRLFHRGQLAAFLAATDSRPPTASSLLLRGLRGLVSSKKSADCPPSPAPPVQVADLPHTLLGLERMSGLYFW